MGRRGDDGVHLALQRELDRAPRRRGRRAGRPGCARARSPARSPLPSPHVPTPMRCVGRESRAIWSSAPTIVISASSGSASARAAISGPIPRGSPRVTASRGLSSSRPRPSDVGRLGAAGRGSAGWRAAAPSCSRIAVAHVLVADVALRARAPVTCTHHELLAAAGAGRARTTGTTVPRVGRRRSPWRRPPAACRAARCRPPARPTGRGRRRCSESNGAPASSAARHRVGQRPRAVHVRPSRSPA